MLLKIVFEKQIRILDCGTTPSINLIHTFIRKSFTKVKTYTLHYLDGDQDQITLETDDDLKVYLEETNKKPKIYVVTVASGFFEESVQVDIDEKNQENIDEVVEEMKKVEIKDEPKSYQIKEQQNVYPKIEQAPIQE